MSEKHGVPAILSIFVPGLGQLVKGDILKGLLFMAIFVFFPFLLLGGIIASRTVFSGLPFFLGPVLYIYNIYDAYNN